MVLRPVPRGAPAAKLLPRLSRRLHPFLLDSATGSPDDGGWSFLGCDPVAVLDARELGSAPLAAACARLEALCDPAARGPHGARPGPRAVGFLAYELGETLEPTVRPLPRPGGAPTDLCLAIYDAVYRWDHALGQGFIEADSDAAADALLAKISRPPPCPARLEPLPAPVSGLGRAGFCARVGQAQELIRAGDLYQVNLSHRLDVAASVDPIALYLALRRVGPASFGAYLDLAGIQVLSTSPERLLSWDRAAGRLETRPIKGTRPRGKTATEDGALSAELLADDKERAEHLMIVDLERNDLGRVARIGSVKVERFARVQTLPRVLHLVSDVVAEARADVTLNDVLAAVFPGGSITGAPKVRAMQVIGDLEPVRRGVYTGAIGHVDRAGGCDLAIAIRTVIAEDDGLHFHVGAGIVDGSVPAREWDETLAKGRALVDALSREGRPAARATAG
jgi:para-aminobenzoate synthetase component 1